MQQKMMPIRVSASVLALATSALPGAGLIDYDAAIAGSGFEQRTTAVSAPLDGTIAVPFNFGAISGDATFEFILAGDPVAGGRDGFLGVGTNATFNLRYEQWDDTGQLGFTHAGVADYLITPAAASPTSNTLVTYRWTQGSGMMDLFLDGALAGSTAAPGFEMPTGEGFLGNNAGLTEGMVGTISRVTTYNSALSDSDILSHGNAWTGIPEPSSLSLLGLTFLAFMRRRR